MQLNARHTYEFNLDADDLTAIGRVCVRSLAFPTFHLFLKEGRINKNNMFFFSKKEGNLFSSNSSYCTRHVSTTDAYILTHVNALSAINVSSIRTMRLKKYAL